MNRLWLAISTVKVYMFTYAYTCTFNGKIFKNYQLVYNEDCRLVGNYVVPENNQFLFPPPPTPPHHPQVHRGFFQIDAPPLMIFFLKGLHSTPPTPWNFCDLGFGLHTPWKFHIHKKQYLSHLF